MIIELNQFEGIELCFSFYQSIDIGNWYINRAQLSVHLDGNEHFSKTSHPGLVILHWNVKIFSFVLWIWWSDSRFIISVKSMEQQIIINCSRFYRKLNSFIKKNVNVKYNAFLSMTNWLINFGWKIHRHATDQIFTQAFETITLFTYYF